MRPNYKERLSILLTGDTTTKFVSLGGTLLATGYERVVIGDRGPYVEFAATHIRKESFKPANEQHWYYQEFRSIPDNVKIYYQLRRVSYADYVPRMFYISPFDLCVNDIRIITELVK